jgi:hypothetical protein
MEENLNLELDFLEGLILLTKSHLTMIDKAVPQGQG